MRLFFFSPKEILQRIQPIYFFLEVSLYIKIMLNRSMMATFHLLVSISRSAQLLKTLYLSLPLPFHNV